MRMHERRSLGSHLLLWKVQARDGGWPANLRMLLLLLHHIVRKEVPEVQAYLEKFFVWDPAHLGEVSHSLQGGVSQHLDLLVGLNAPCDLLNEVDIVLQY